MRKESKFSLLVSKVVACLFALLGFSACSSEENGRGGLFMYGTPTADFTIKGKVVDSENNESGLSDIQLVVRSRHNLHYADTLVTDKDGEFVYQSGWISGTPLRLIYEDTENGVFKKDSVDVEFEQVKPGDGAWYNGEYEADLTIKMERKTEEEEEEKEE